MFGSLFTKIGVGQQESQREPETHDLEARKGPFSSLKSSFDAAHTDVKAPVATITPRKSSSNESKQDTPIVWKASQKEKLIMFTCAVSSLVVALDATILVPVLPTLAVDLHGTSAEAFWTGTSYLLTHAVLQPFMAALSDIFGRRELLVPSIALFAIGSIVCGVAHDFTTMLIGRVVQGIGGAGIITLTQLIFADLVPLRQRPKYMSVILGAWAFGSLIGPLLGGIFVQKATWRWCFWLNLPICGVALPMAIVFVTLTQPATDLATKLKKVDWTGNFLFISSLTSLLIAISWAGIQFPWSSYQTLVPICLGVVGLVAAIVYEIKVATHPFLRYRIFNGRSTIASYTAAVLQGFLVYIALYYMSFYFTACHFFIPIRTGLSIFPSTATLIPGSVVVSSLITRFGRYRWAIWAGYAISTIGCGLMIMWDDKTPTVVWAVSQCLFGLGLGMVLTSVNFSIQAAVDPEDAGQAATMYAFLRSIGMAFGVAVGGTVFQNTMKGRLQYLGVPNAAEIANQAEGFVHHLEVLSTEGAAGVTRRAIMSGYVHGFRGVWIVMTALSAVGLLVSLLIQRNSLDAVLVSKFQVEERQSETK